MSGQVESIRHALAAVVASLEVVRETWKREPDRARAAASRIARSLMSLAPRAGDRALLAAALASLGGLVLAFPPR